MRPELTRKKLTGYWGWTFAIFFAVLAAEIIGAYYFMYVKGYGMADAMSRTANAYYTIYMDPPNIASIGFVWNPLPSIIQIPILLFANIWPPLAAYGVSGGIMTAIFAALNAAYLFRGFKFYTEKTGIALLMVLLYASNPFVFYYGCNGMSETPFFFALIVCVFSLARWYENRSTLELIVIAFALALGFLCRYEAFAAALGIAAALLVIIFWSKDEYSPFQKTFKMKVQYTLATYVVVFLPLIVTVLAWMLLSWAIIGNPIYFVNSVYSNTAQTGFVGAELNVYSFSSAMSVLGISFGKLLPFILPYFVIVGERLFTKRIIKADFWALTAVIAVFFGFHYLMLVLNKSYGWLRFFSYALIITVAFLPYEMSKLKKIAKSIFVAVMCAVFALSAGIVFNYFKTQPQSPEEYEAFYQTDVSGIASQRAAAQLINEKYYDAKILMDSFMTSTMILNLDHPENLIINTTETFDEALHNPQRYGVQYIVVADPSGVGALDAINLAYPGIYSGGAEGFKQVENLDGFKIFEVLY